MAVYLIGLGKALFIFLFALILLPVNIYLERKGSAFIQDRVGPNRAAILGVRLAGFIHLIADVVKLIFKEMMVPGHVNRWYFMIAPFIGFTFILFAFAVIPWADNLSFGSWNIPMQVADLNGGILFILAVTSLNVYGIVLAGWASNNKFSLLGGLRATAQMVSYEIPLGLSLVGVFMVFQSVHLNEIVRGQGELLFGFLPKWGVFVQPLGFFLFGAAAFAETNRNPFDVAEGESEIVAGYHTEYSGIRFALFYMGEYVAIALAAAMLATLYFGGWQIPWVTTDMLRNNSELALKIMLSLGTVGSFVGLLTMLGFDKKMRGTWPAGDLRNQEGRILGGIAFLLLVAHIAALVFFNGKVFPEWGQSTVAVLAQVAMFTMKTLFFCWVFIWVRWTLPRFRYDQIMRLGWKNLIPISFLNIFVTGLVILLLDSRGG
ncbi:MAG: NADH-quinone oxidoreductase subunit H [bacterium]|nr:NADH-quinone oxidoreductase subunit H [bacterium]